MGDTEIGDDGSVITLEYQNQDIFHYDEPIVVCWKR
jgi:hypothetical protein